MNRDIRILHQRRSVGETIAWSMRFAYHYNALCVENINELFEGINGSGIILIDGIHFLQIPERRDMPQCPIIVLLDDIESNNAVEVLLAGAETVVDLSRGPEAVLEKLHQVIESVIDDENVLIRKLILERVGDKQPQDENDYNLTIKEKEILKLLSEGVYLKLIAQKTGTSYETVRTHVKHIYKKIGVMSAAEAVLKSMKMNL